MDPVTRNLPFIVSTDRQKADPETRKLIRSHVMRGKNRVKPRRKPRGPLHGDSLEAESSIVTGLIYPLSIPMLLSSKFAAIRFADDSVDPALIADVLSFASMSSRAMFQLEQCIAAKTDGMAHEWFAPMLFDAAYLNAACFTIQAYFDQFLARTRSAEARQRDYVYYAKTVGILQNRLALDDDSVRLSDSTIMTVLSMSGHAYMTGDYESANHHSSGLLKLASMRGVGSFAQNTKLLIEIVRCDLCLAIDRGSEPLLFAPDNIPWPLMLPSGFTTVPGEKVPSTQLRNKMTSRLSPDLAAVWAAMSNFCTLINAIAENGGIKMTEEVFLQSLGSIIYRLLYQRFEPGSLDEAFRLGLLAFSSPIFLHWNRVELPDRLFNSTYREALARLDASQGTVEPREHLWLLMVGALSMSHEPDSVAWLKPQLQKTIELCNAFTWDSVRDLLSSLLWVGLVYDSAGRDAFDSILR
ncbi:hypothetical protein GGR54DRAFT_372948 [Hypoxylon sp. NC1633]|nr:hypothetical protein GGR54DRAFT_372948 [Hypoxylon sp. NC1633]